MIYLVSYDLVKAAERDYTPVYEAIKSIGPWWHYLDSTWIVQSCFNVNRIVDTVHAAMRQGDRLLVVQIDNQNRNGWLPEEAWNWIRTHEEVAGPNTH